MRLANDLDYIFVPYKSKRDIVDEIVACRRPLEGFDLDDSLSSQPGG